MSTSPHSLLRVLVLLNIIIGARAGAVVCSTNAQCNNQGTCVGNTCNCDAGFFGTTCTDMCASNGDCNGGTCNSAVNPKVCVCPETKYGSQCENTQICATDTDCQNGGTCNKTAVAHVCNCASGLTGNVCQTAQICATDTGCQNGGTCNKAAVTHVCNCAPGFTGNVCQTGNSFAIALQFSWTIFFISFICVARLW